MSGSRAVAGKIQDELDHISQKERKKRKKKKRAGGQRRKERAYQKESIERAPKGKARII